MTLTLDLKPEKEARLARKAQQQGLSVADYARSILEREADAPTETDTLAEEEAELNALIAKIGPLTAKLPLLSPDAVAMVYEERETGHL